MIYIKNEKDIRDYIQYCQNNIKKDSLWFTRGYNINYIPDGIFADKIIIDSNSINVLPTHFKCNYLCILQSSISTITLEQTKNIHICISIHNKQNLVLPDNIHIGSLDLSNSHIDKLPKNLYIRNFLDISNTKIEVIPDGTYIGYSIMGLNSKYHKVNGYLFNNNGYFNVMRKFKS